MRPATLGFVWLCMLGAVVVSPSAVAQNRAEGQHSLSCSNSEGESTFNAELNHPSKLVIAPVTNDKEIAQAQNGGWHTLYSKIDAAKYGIDRVDFYVQQERPKEPEQAPPYAPLTIYVKLSSPNEVSSSQASSNKAPNQLSLWKIVEPDGYRAGESFLIASLPNGEEDTPPVTIVPATGDGTVPLFELQFGSQQAGTWANSVEAHILLDFRRPLPAIAADLSCNSIEAFGVCGVWDGAMQDRNNYQCDWVAADNDFRCEATTWNPRVNKRRTTAWFQLLSGKDIPFAVPAGNPATLQQFAELAERDPSWRNRQVELPGLGKTSHILRIVDGPKRSSHIFGTYGGTQPFGAHFFYVVLTPGAAPELGYIPALSLFDVDPDGKLRHQEVVFAQGVADQQKLPTPGNQIDSGTSLSFGVKELFTEPQTHIYRITAREDDSRAVYWLAIDHHATDGKTIFSMTKLAGTGTEYVQCGRYRTEASATIITRQRAPNFRVLIDVEPSHFSSEASEGFFPPDENNGEKPEDQCPYSHHLEWNHTDWVTDEAVTKCGPTFRPRAISIDDDGIITAKPAQVETSQ